MHRYSFDTREADTNAANLYLQYDLQDIDDVEDVLVELGLDEDNSIENIRRAAHVVAAMAQFMTVEE